MNTRKKLAVSVALPALLLLGGQAAAAAESAPTDATVSSPAPPGSYPAPSGEWPADWAIHVDDTQTISIAVPPTWTDVDTVPMRTEAGTPGPWISATTDQDAMFPADGVADTFTVPGVVYTVAPYTEDTAGLVTAAGAFYDTCTPGALSTFASTNFAGHVQTFSACGGTASSIVHVAASPADASYTAVLLIQLTGTPEDATILDGILGAFGRVG